MQKFTCRLFGDENHAVLCKIAAFCIEQNAAIFN